MYQLVDIIDIMVGDYDHCPTWKELNLSGRTVLEVGHAYQNKPVLVHSEDGVAIDFQILEIWNDKLPLYIKEPFSATLRDRLRTLLHTQTLVEKDAVWVVVEANNVATDIRADMVTLSIPKSARHHPSIANLLKSQPAGDAEPVIFVSYTEEAMREFLPRGCVILDYIYFL